MVKLRRCLIFWIPPIRIHSHLKKAEFSCPELVEGNMVQESSTFGGYIHGFPVDFCLNPLIHGDFQALSHQVVLTVPRRMALSADASYLLSGGMGALGLVTAQALAEEGAKSLLLMSRSCEGQCLSL